VDRVFLDANVLFSALYRESSGILRIWKLSNVEIITSYFALHEAQRNAVSDEQLTRLNQLPLTVVMPVWTRDKLPDDVAVAEKDIPILLDAINASATHLLTGDKQHFGALYDRSVAGVLIQPPSAYLASRTVT
jgi:predicted nucleic acid-binding protein